MSKYSRLHSWPEWHDWELAIHILHHRNTGTKKKKKLQILIIYLKLDKPITNFWELWPIKSTSLVTINLKYIESKNYISLTFVLLRPCTFKACWLLNLPRTIRKAFQSAIPISWSLTGRSYSEENISRRFQWVPPAWRHSSARVPGPSGF